MGRAQRFGFSRAAAAITALGLAVSLAAQAVAAPATMVPPGTVTVSRACYVNTARAAAQIIITGTGWQAGATIELTDTLNELSATTTANAGGDFTYAVPAPVVDSSGTQPVSDAIEAYEGTPGEAGPTDSATATSATFATTNYVVLVTGHSHNPDVRRTFELSGFTPHRIVYAHFLDAHGRLLSTESFGAPAGACGLRRVTAYEYPGGHPRPGSYTIQFDDSRHFTRSTQPQYRYSFSVPRA